MKTLPIVSIVISSYFGGKYLQEAVDSIKAQTFTDWELTIVDDTWGKDELPEKIDLPENGIVVHTNDIGLSQTRMWGVNWSMDGSKYLLFMDADDKIHPTFLEKTVKLLEDSPEVSFAYTDTQHFDGANSFWEQPEYNFNALLMGNYICSCSLIRKKDFIAAGGFDINNFNYWEDYECWINMGSKGFYGKHLPEKLFYYRIRKDSGMQSDRNDKLGFVYKAYIVNKFETLYPRGWGEQAREILSHYPANFMKWKPKEQEQFLKEHKNGRL